MTASVPPPRFLEEVDPVPRRGAALPAPDRGPATGHAAPSGAEGWAPDILGDGYECRPLDLAPDDEGDVAATLVRYRPHGTSRTARAVLYLHGWSDYFFQTQTAELWHGLGAAFYALDLRKYGRSLRPGQTPGYVANLRTYDEDIAAALVAIHADLGPHVSVMLMGHSTGGLVSVLWAHRHPGVTTGLVLNSPWLELQGSSVVRTVSAPAISQLARFQPKTPLPNIDPGFYARTIRRSEGGEWDFDDRWRPMPAFPVRAGWLNAVIAGHAEVARGLAITQPILMLASTRTMIAARWHEQMRESDVVLDVELLARRAVQLGPTVTISRIAGGLHDLALSATTARAAYYAQIARWSTVYGWSDA